MLAFLFDRKSGTLTGLAVAALAVILFAGGVLVGLNIRWSREEAIATALQPTEVAGRLKARLKAKSAQPATPAAGPEPAASTPATSPAGGN